MERTKFFIGLLLLIFVSTNAPAQRFTLDNILPEGKDYKFQLTTYYLTDWFEDDLVTMFSNQILLTDIQNPKRDPKLLFNNNQLIKQTKDRKNANVSKMTFIPIQGKYYGKYIFNNEIFYIDLKKKKTFLHFKPKDDYANLDFCSENLHLAFTQNNALGIMNSKNEAKIIAQDENITYGETPYDYHLCRENNCKGAFWSPKGSYLTFYKFNTNDKYENVNIGIYSMESGKILYLNTGNDYLTNISWDPTEDFVYITEFNKKQNHLKLNKYSTKTGEKVLTLFEENDDRFITPTKPLTFLKTKLDQFIWWSTRDGNYHLYLYNTSGELIKQLTSGKENVIEMCGIYNNDETLYFRVATPNSTENCLYELNLTSGKTEQLSRVYGVHDIKVSASGKYILDKYSTLDILLNTDLINREEQYITQFVEVKDPTKGYPSIETNIGTIKSADKTTDLYYRLTKLSALESNKKYPVIINLESTDGVSTVVNRYAMHFKEWEIFMAQEEYIVFTLANRGTRFRDADFEKAPYGQLGIVETADQMEGIEFIKSLPYVDPERIGVVGENYGGLIGLNMMLRYPEVVKTGVVKTPFTDFQLARSLWSERYLGTPQENPEGYEKINMNKLAGNLKGKLLLMYGEDSDDLIKNSTAFINAAKEANVPLDVFTYPGSRYNIGGDDKIIVYRKMTDYFNANLKGE